MRVLCLHGFRTSAKILEEQMKPLVGSLPSSWQFTYLNAPNVATGDTDEAVKIAFPKLTEYYEWYNWKKLDDGSFAYDEGFEISINFLRQAILASSYDVLLGFSQGGLMAGLLTAMCERGMIEIPSHRRWKFAALFNAPFPRGDKLRFADKEQWCTPTLLVFGNKDKLIDASNWTLQNAVKVFTEESHALPRLPNSVISASEALKKLCSRTWFAFDFDGVVCDSARETAITAWKASSGIVDGADGISSPSEEVIDKFCKARPLLETGFEAIVILYRLCVLKQEPSVMLDSANPVADMENALSALGLTADDLKSRFQKSREGWIAKNESDWLAANRFYAPTVDAMKVLIKQGVSVYVVTTKHASFAKKLLQQQGVVLSDDRIFGLGSGKKRDVISTLAREREARLGGSCVFVEDRIETLRDVAKHASVSATLVVAGYGYNTEKERKQAREKDGFLVFSTSEELQHWLCSQ